jgi:hypothetical protein
MARRSKTLPPVPTWTCTYCGFVHTPANLFALGHRAACQWVKRQHESELRVWQSAALFVRRVYPILRSGVEERPLLPYV